MDKQKTKNQNQNMYLYEQFKPSTGFKINLFLTFKDANKSIFLVALVNTS